MNVTLKQRKETLEITGEKTPKVYGGVHKNFAWI